jgi:hypothetical protein
VNGFEEKGVLGYQPGIEVKGQQLSIVVKPADLLAAFKRGTREHTSSRNVAGSNLW